MVERSKVEKDEARDKKNRLKVNEVKREMFPKCIALNFRHSKL